MSINIEQAVEAAAKELHNLRFSDLDWEEMTGAYRFACKEDVLPIVDAAVNSIAAQAWSEGYNAAFQDMLNYGATENPYVEEEA